jgi:hypothetical protein
MRNRHAVSGVTVTWDAAKHSKINVKDGGHDKTKIPRSAHSDDEFTPSRIVVDLKLDLGDPNVPEVYLNDVHVEIAYSGVHPIVGWWNGAKWVKFRQVTYANGVADVTLPSPWPTDPHIGAYP